MQGRQVHAIAFVFSRLPCYRRLNNGKENRSLVYPVKKCTKCNRQAAPLHKLREARVSPTPYSKRDRIIHATLTCIHNNLRPSCEALARLLPVVGGKVSRYPPALRKPSRSVACQVSVEQEIRPQAHGGVRSASTDKCTSTFPAHVLSSKSVTQARRSFFGSRNQETRKCHHTPQNDGRGGLPNSLTMLRQHPLVTLSTANVTPRKANRISSTAVPHMSTSRGRALEALT